MSAPPELGQEPIDPKGPQEYNLQKIQPSDYETLGFLLAHAEHSDVVIVRNKDRGLDARLPDPTGRVTLRGWQVKHFSTGSIHWPQCFRSLDDAVTFWRPLRVTFVFAHDLSAKEQDEFVSVLVNRHPYVRVDHWGASEVQRRLRDTEEGRRAAVWLFGSGATIDDLMAALVSKEPVRTSEEIATRQAALQERLDSDPHFYYSTISRSPGAPETSPAAETIASVVLVIDGQEVRYDLAERYPGAMTDLGGGPLLVVADDETGRQAREAIEQALTKAVPTTISSGLGVAWPSIPVGLRGLIPEQPIWRPVKLVPQESHVEHTDEAVLPIMARAGEASLGMSFVLSDESREGYDETLVAATGGLELLYSVRGETPGELEHHLDWRHTLGVGPALEQLLSCRITLAVLDGASLVLSPPSQRDATFVAAAAEHNFSDQDIDRLRIQEQFLRLVCELQAWIGRPLEPLARPTNEDAAELGRALGLIRKPQRKGYWSELKAVMTREPPSEVFQLVVLERVYATLFGVRIYLGMDLIALGAARIAHRDGQDVRLEPADDGKVIITLQHPDLAPPDAARPRYGAEEHGRVIVAPITDDSHSRPRQAADKPREDDLSP